MNMQSLILRTAGHFLLPLLLLFSLFMLFRGHNEPGGGFIAGLIAASALVLYLFSMDIASARRVLRVDPRSLLGGGMVLAVLSGVPGVFRGQAFFTAQWWELSIIGIGKLKLSTVLFFDIGVYMVVVGAVLTIMFALAEAED